MSDWKDRAAEAAERRNRMMSFGPHAYGLLVKGRHGLFAVDPEDISVTGWLLREGTYAEDELALASSFIDDASDVLIVGTHIGALAVPLSKRCRSLDVVEANPDTQKLLKANLLLNECSNATLHCIAASDSREPIEFMKNRDNSGGSKRKPLVEHMHYVYDDPEIVTIDAWPLDDRLDRKFYDLIIMDIEGSEYFALKGMQDILSKSRVVGIEFLPHHLTDVAGVSVEQFCEQIIPHFSWMYVPGQAELVERDRIQQGLQHLYDTKQGQDVVYFLKDISDTWMQRWNVSKPGPA